MTAAPSLRCLLTPAEALRAGPDVVGGKAYGLARLARVRHLDARVPPWLVLPASGHEADVEEELQAAAELLAPGPFAVRSSAVGEDGERHSWAGQLESVLGVQPGDLLDAVRRCWRSARSERAVDYRRRAGELHETPVAVIVQRLVPADVAGVLFTADPLSGDTARMRVSACVGLGDRLVSGECDADEYVLSSAGEELSAHLAGTTRTLAAPQLRRLALVGRRIAELEGSPRDIEWAIVGEDLYVLQSRPITARPAPATVWDNSNIQESYFGVTTPLTFSFARAAYASVYEQTMRTLGISERLIAEHRPMLRNLLGLINGRVYYNLGNWYRGLLLLPAFRRNKEDMERMMGVEEPVDFVEDGPPGRALGVLPAIARLLLRFATLRRDSTRFLAHIDATLGAIDRASLPSRSLAELMTMLERLRSDCIERWTTPIVNDFFVMMTTGRLRRLVDGETMQLLLAGADVAVSAEPAMLMLRMAAIIREETLEPLVRRSDHGGALHALRNRSRRFAATYDALIDRFGDRCMGELKLESRPLRDDPRFVVEMLRNYLASDITDVKRVSVEPSQEKLGVLRRVRLRRTLRAARHAIRMREEMRLARTRLFGVHRDIYKAIGGHLHRAGRLRHADDVFYLTTNEIAEYWEGTTVTTDLGAVAAVRRVEFAKYEDVPAPNRVVTYGAPADAKLEPCRTRDAARRILTGLACSPGIAEGPVRIVTSAADNLSLAGHVLVAPRTDPGWSPLFPSAVAIVVERGSLLSHSAVLARELGIPAVVGIPGIVGALRDGERVRVNGLTGEIERLEASCDS